MIPWAPGRICAEKPDVMMIFINLSSEFVTDTADNQNIS